MLNGKAWMPGREIDLRERLLRFAIRLIKLCGALPDTPEGRVVRGQLLRCGTSPGAQYREACRARSTAEFISKMEAVEQELDETDYWLLIIERANLMRPQKLRAIQAETMELIKIFAASVTTAKRRR